MRTAEPRPTITSSDQLGIADKLAFLACYSRYYLSVSADNHAHLASLLASELSGVTPICLIAEADLPKADATHLVAAGFGLRDTNSGNRSPLEIMSGLVEDSAVRPLVIVEAADKLTDDQLKQLLILTERVGLGVALFARKNLSARRACAPFRSRMYQTEVSKLSTNDVRQMVRQRNNNGEARLSELDIDQLIDQSDGRPEKLDGMIEEMIDRTGSRLGLPLVHMSGLVVLALVLVGGWLSMQSDETEAIPVALETESRSDQSGFTPIPKTAKSAASQLSASSDAQIPEAIAADQRIGASEAAGSPAAAPAREEAESAVQNAELDVAENSGADAEDPARQPTNQNGATSPTRLASRDPNDWVNALPATAAGAESVPAPAQKRWLQSAPDSAYTLQLMGSHSETRVLEFIAEQGNDHAFGYFKTTHRNQPWFVLTVGQYADRDNALLAIEQLPPELRAQKPWARSVASIRD